jgi:hypothetical protein
MINTLALIISVVTLPIAIAALILSIRNLRKG